MTNEQVTFLARAERQNRLQHYGIDLAIVQRLKGVTNPGYVNRTVEQDCLMQLRIALFEYLADCETQRRFAELDAR